MDCAVPTRPTRHHRDGDLPLSLLYPSTRHLKNYGKGVRQCPECFDDFVTDRPDLDRFCTDFCEDRYNNELADEWDEM